MTLTKSTSIKSFPHFLRTMEDSPKTRATVAQLPKLLRLQSCRVHQSNGKLLLAVTYV